MSAERIYRLLLRAYPPAFRAEFGREMVLVFRDQCRDGDVRTLGFWVRVFWDVVRSAPALRAEATRTVEVIMKLAAILTVLLGVFPQQAIAIIEPSLQQVLRLATDPGFQVAIR